jgi:tRNA(Ile)-lysidine synthase
MQSHLESQISKAGLVSGDRLLVAVSGGVDSVVLLHLLHASAPRFGLYLHAAHLDHQIRPESAADADFVRQACKNLEVPCVVETCDVPALAAAEKMSLEMAGRQARRKFLQRRADQTGARLIVLAHHRGDQVETFLLRLLRGSGMAGLAAMVPLQDRWWRPLLDCRREDILAYAQRQQLQWVEDESNLDPAYLRNRLRHQVLPLLRDINPQLDRRLAELCHQLQADDDDWQQRLTDVFPTLLLDRRDGLRLDRQKLLALSEALLMRVLREALRQVRGDLQRLEAVHLHAINKLLNGDRSQAQLDLPGCWVARRYETLWVRRGAQELLAKYDLQLPVPGTLQLPCGRIMQAQLRSEAAGESLLVAEFCWAELEGPLRIRSWQPGDRFEPQGMTGSKKLKRLFGDLQIELEDRYRTPVLVSGETILWVAGMRRSRHAAVAANSQQILHLELL